MVSQYCKFIKMKVSISFLVLLAVAHAEFFWGGCPNADVISNLDLSKFVGQWYEAARTMGAPG